MINKYIAHVLIFLVNCFEALIEHVNISLEAIDVDKNVLTKGPGRVKMMQNSLEFHKTPVSKYYTCLLL